MRSMTDEGCCRGITPHPAGSAGHPLPQAGEGCACIWRWSLAWTTHKEIKPMLENRTIKTDHGKVVIQTIIELYLPGPVCLPPRCLTEDEFVAFQKDPEAFIARHFDVTIDEYLHWRAADGVVQCSAKTQSGKRCQRAVSGPSERLPKEWLAAQGQYCTQHGGPTSIECRPKR